MDYREFIINPTEYVFKGGAPLKPFLVRHYPKYEFGPFQIQDIMSDMRSLTTNYDSTNTDIVLCHEELDKALCVKAFHKHDLKWWICQQIIKADAHDSRPFIVPTPTLTIFPYYEITDPKTYMAPIWERETFFHRYEFVNPDTLCRVKPAFLRVIRTLSGVDQNRVRFKYSELAHFLRRYISENVDKLIDERNSSIAHCQGDILANAFRVRTFHKSQGMQLIKTQLI